MSNDALEPDFSNYGTYEISENLEFFLPDTVIKIEKIGDSAFSYFRRNSEGGVVEKIIPQEIK